MYRFQGSDLLSGGVSVIAASRQQLPPHGSAHDDRSVCFVQTEFVSSHGIEYLVVGGFGVGPVFSPVQFFQQDQGSPFPRVSAPAHKGFDSRSNGRDEFRSGADGLRNTFSRWHCLVLNIVYIVEYRTSYESIMLKRMLSCTPVGNNVLIRWWSDGYWG